MKPDSQQPKSEATFDYSIWPDDFSEFARGVVERTRQRRAAHTMGVIDSGLELQEIRYAVPFSLFEKWRQDLDMSRRSAECRMRVAEMFGELREQVSHLSARILYSLSAPNAPKATVDSIIDRLRRGERPSEGEIRVLVYTAKRYQKARADHARRNRELRRQRAFAPLLKRSRPP